MRFCTDRWSSVRAVLVVVLALAASARAQVTDYVGRQLTNPTGSLTFTWPGSSGSLANYHESGLYVTAQASGSGQGCTGGPRGGGCCIPYGFSHGGWYYPAGLSHMVEIYPANGMAMAGLEFQVGDYVNGCGTNGDGHTYVWALVYSGGTIVGNFDLDVVTGSYIGFAGVFDRVRLFASHFRSVRDLHNENTVQTIGLDNMTYVTSDCPAFGAPSTIYTCADGANTFSVSAIGAAPIFYQWQWQPLGASTWTDVVEGVNVADAPFAFTAAGAQSPSLTRTGSLTPGLVIQLRCVVSNACSSVAGAPATLGIRTPPIFVQQPTDESFCGALGAATYSVEVDPTPADPGPFTYRWQGSTNGRTWQNLTESEGVIGTTTPYLSWQFDAPEAHQFRCVVTNPCGSTTSDVAHLTFGGGPSPTIYQQPVDATTCRSAPFGGFEILPDGNDPVSIQWRVETPANSGTFVNLHDGTFTEAASGMSFAIQGATGELPFVLVNTFGTHASTVRFNAVISNSCGSTTSDTVALTICVADVDDGSGTGTCDGGVTIDDLLYYLGLFEQGAVAADVDDGTGTGTPDGGVTIDDLLYYLVRFEAGC